MSWNDQILSSRFGRCHAVIRPSARTPPDTSGYARPGRNNSFKLFYFGNRRLRCIYERDRWWGVSAHSALSLTLCSDRKMAVRNGANCAGINMQQGNFVVCAPMSRFQQYGGGYDEA